MKHLLLLQPAALILFIYFLAPMAFGQDTFVTIPTERAAQYRLNFSRNFFSSPEAEVAARATLYSTLEKLEALKGKVGHSAAQLEAALKLNDQILIELNRHYSYLYLRYAVDTRDDRSLEASSALEADVTKRTSFLRDELLKIDPKTVANLVREKPSLKSYLFALEREQRYRQHTLSVKEEELLKATAPNNDWPYQLYEKVRPRAPVSPIPANADSNTRASIFKRNYVSQNAQRDLFAFALVNLARARTRLAEIHHFPDAASEHYFKSYWTKAEVDQLIDHLSSKAEIYKRYQRLRADYVKKRTGLADINVWDLGLERAGIGVPRFTIDQATETISQALSPLGMEYGKELAALLDPANGRMDIVPGDHRKSGGFSQGFIGTDSVFFSQGFRGYYNDVRVLAHESTHAVHRQLMNRNHVLPLNADGPNYLFEAFAIFSEFLLMDYLYDHETDPLKKQIYLEQFFEGKGTTIFSVAPEVALEHAVYEGISKGSVNTADDLDAITKRIYSRFSIWSERHDELKAQWINVRLMYEDPFYDVNYVYGALVALNFYDLFKKDRERFIKGYAALMRNGFDAKPEALLRRFMNVELHDPRLVSNAIATIEGKMKLLEEAYKR